jgi:hypothetical protein
VKGLGVLLAGEIANRAEKIVKILSLAKSVVNAYFLKIFGEFPYDIRILLT